VEGPVGPPITDVRGCKSPPGATRVEAGATANWSSGSMPLTIAPYGREDVTAVKEFNQRLLAGGAPARHLCSETHVPAWLPPTAGVPVRNEFFVAKDQEGVRGTFTLKFQEFSFGGRIQELVCCHHPISEGIVNKKFAHVGMSMVMHMLRRHPVLFALGMGGYDQPMPRLLVALKWHHCLLPLQFRVNRPARFLRELRSLREPASRRRAAGFAAASGLGWAGLHALHGLRGFAGMRVRSNVTVVGDFGPWADDLWAECASSFTLIGMRNSATLRALYPASSQSIVRLQVRIAGRLAGWAVVAIVQHANHDQYGDLRVGTIVDGLAAAPDVPAVVAAATRALLDRGVDVITSNQSHQAWVQALGGCGYLDGPSNFIFAVSSPLATLLNPFAHQVAACHVNRGDGDSAMQFV
jgi:hypothetical protein